MPKKKKTVKKKTEPYVPVPGVPHQFKCKNCGVEYENSNTNNPDCPECKRQGCADRTG